MTADYGIKLLLVNLTNHSIESMTLAAETVRKYIGGTGIAAKILWDETKADTEPFSEENPLIFMTGPLTGTVIPSSSRFVAAAISPLTGIWGEGYGGGTFAHALSRTPYRGIIIRGKAREPVALKIDANGAIITDASYLWGRDTFEVDEIINAEVGRKASILTIGPAGEKQVKFASIMGDGKAARAIARCGLGAVMGWKKLKAVIVMGDDRIKPRVFDEEKLKASVQEYFPRVQFDSERWQRKADRHWPPTKQPTSIKNYTMVELPGFITKAFHDPALEATPCYCTGCRTGCFLSMWHGDQKFPPGQHLETFGANCLIDDIEALGKAFELCNRLGMDSISTGQTITLAMELFEKGLLTKKDCDGIDLVWGNAQSMLEVITKIGDREGIGVLLGEGTRTIAEKIGGKALEYAMQTKGLEFPRYDPRSNNAMALQYATGSRGANHMEGFLGILMRFLFSNSTPYALPYLESKDARDTARDLLAVKGNAELVIWSQNFSSALDSLGVCKFLGNPGVWINEPAEDFPGISPEQFLAWLNHVTGWDMDFPDFIKTGERIFNLKRVFNVRRGVTKEDDTLPVRIQTQPRGGDKPDAINLPPLESMLNEYYRLRGWVDNGVPNSDKLAELDLQDLA